MAIRGMGVQVARACGSLALIVALTTGAVSEPLPALDAVRLFLGLQSASPIHAQSVESTPDGIVVKALDAPLGAASDAPRLRVESLVFSNIVTQESAAVFGSVIGTGVTVSGAADLAARSVMLTDVRARDLGLKPLSVASLDNLMMTQVSVAGLARLESYALSFSGDMAGRFSGSLQIDGLQVAALASAGVSDRFEIRLDYEGDGSARTFVGRPRVANALLGVAEGEARWSDVDFHVETASPLAQFDLMRVVTEGLLDQARLSVLPGPNARMLVRSLTAEQKADVTSMVRRSLERDGSVSSDRIVPIVARTEAFLANPDRVTVEVAPTPPVALNQMRLDRLSMREVLDRLGFRIEPQGRSEALVQPAR
jgi:hypothetical protein